MDAPRGCGELLLCLRLTTFHQAMGPCRRKSIPTVYPTVDKYEYLGASKERRMSLAHHTPPTSKRPQVT